MKISARIRGRNAVQYAQNSNPKLEFRNPKHVQMSQVRRFRISNFGFRIARQILGSGCAGWGQSPMRFARCATWGMFLLMSR
jgi:hypothetical protein